MFIAVCLENYSTLSYTIIFVVPSVIARASTSGSLLCILDNTQMRETLDEKIFGR